MEQLICFIMEFSKNTLEQKIFYGE